VVIHCVLPPGHDDEAESGGEWHGSGEQSAGLMTMDEEKCSSRRQGAMYCSRWWVMMLMRCWRRETRMADSGCESLAGSGGVVCPVNRSMGDVDEREAEEK
jgi:hypothetical protein